MSKRFKWFRKGLGNAQFGQLAKIEIFLNGFYGLMKSALYCN